MSKKSNISARHTEENKDLTRELIINMLNSKKDVTKVEEQDNTKAIDELSKKWNMNDKIIGLFAEGISKDQELRGKYAKILIGILIVQLLALFVVFVLRGCNVLNYSDSTLNIYISGGIAEVFVLVRVIVKYLFKDNLTSSLNIILENNNKIKYNSKWKNTKNNNEKKD